MIDIRQTPQYANYLSKIGWEVERINGVNYFIKKFPIIGSIIKIQRPETINYELINELTNKYHAFQVIIEPKNMANGQWLMANGFKSSNSPYLPTKTLQLDLSLSINRLISGAKKDSRYSLRKAQMSKLKCQNENKIENFRENWKRAVGWKRYVPPLFHLTALKKSFKENCLLYCSIAVEQDRVDAGAIFLLADGIAYYWQAFTNAEGRRLMAQYRIVWEGILWAKKKGAKFFDFEGIYDERFPNKSWLGFTHFKKSFGGAEVVYPGTYTKFLLPFSI